MARRRMIRKWSARASLAAHRHRHNLRRRPDLEILEDRIVLATFTVDLTTDTKPTTGGSGSGLTGDLRYCIDQADSNNQANTIVFDPTVFNTPQTITLGGIELVLSDTGGKQTITGPAAAVTISGDNDSGILQVDYTVTSSISGLTFSRGSVGSEGGAIADAGTLTLTSCVITGNSAGAFGGGIANIESLTLTDCTLSGNSSGIIGGGIGNRGELTLTNCTVSSNSAGLSGGGIENSGSLTLNDSAVSSNSAREDGGGLDGSTGEISLTSSTISDNSAVAGGGIAIASGSLTITTSTISGNAAQGAAGKDGSAGAHGSNYTFSNRYQGNGGNGSSGESGGSAEGGGLFVASGTVDLMSSTFSNNTAEGGAGGKGGKGGTGGNGAGGNASLNSNHSHQQTGGPGAKGGSGGVGGAGGNGLGGGLYLAKGSLTITNATFAGNQAIGGAGGQGGTGGKGGTGGSGDFSVINHQRHYDARGGTGGPAGAAGTGGAGGEVGGGGLYIVGGTAKISYATVADNDVSGSSGGLGGDGGQGGAGGNGVPNGPTGKSTPNGPDGNSWFGGSIGDNHSIGGGIQVSVAATLSDTIVANNTSFSSSPTDVAGTLNLSSKNNLFGTGGSGGLTNGVFGNIVLTSPSGLGLAALGDFGGPTQTMALEAGSPAIGAGDLVNVYNLTDQRGFTRAFFSYSDIGAFQTESQIVVNNTTDVADELTPLGQLSLRQAVNLANVTGAAATITFDPTVFGTQQTIDLAAGQLELNDTGGVETIIGPSAGLTIDAGGQSRVFQVDSGTTASISGLTISGGSAANGGGVNIDLGTLTLADCTISGNRASDSGGGLQNSGALTLSDSTISDNSAGADGGGLHLSGTATVVDCTISGNSASGGGGGVEGGSGVTLTDCTVSANTASSVAGGIYAKGATLTSCTVSGNSASFGGGVCVGRFAAVTVTACTISKNSAPQYSYGGMAVGYGGSLTLVDTIVAGNSHGDFLGTFSGSNDLLTGSPMLAPLGYYGGPTETMPLLPGSPALGSGIEADYPGTTTPITTDQRGLALDSPDPDIGAFQSDLVVNTTTDVAFGVPSVPDVLSLRQAVGLADLLGGTQTITFAPSAFATPKTINLTAGPLELSDTGGMLTIIGPAAGLTISGDGLSDVLVVDSRVTASLSGLTITGGSAVTTGGIVNYGNLTLTDCTITGNSAEFNGGIDNIGELSLTDSTVSGNSGEYGAGGIYNYGGQLTLTGCTISGNRGKNGAGLNNGSYFGLHRLVGGTATLVNCTISGNDASGVGGAVDVAAGAVTLTACTVSANSAGVSGGGAYVADGIPGLTVLDTIVAGNAAAQGADIAGPVAANLGHNLIGGDPLLAPLGNYGGPTQTMPLLPGSPAIAMGIAVSGITTDQRGFPLDSPNPDIGAFQNSLVVSTTTDAAYGLLSPPGELSLRQAVGLADFLGATQTITFDPSAFATAQVINLTAGSLELSDTGGVLTIIGPAAGLTISGDGLSDVLVVDSGVTASLSGLTITGGSAVSTGGIVNYGDLTLSDCTVSGNSAQFNGGIDNIGELSLTDSTVSGNSGEYGAGGIYNYGGQLTLTGCTISGNRGKDGAGLNNGSYFFLHGLVGGTATLVDCTISGNDVSGVGGGVDVAAGAVTMTACTVSANSAGVSGGGVYVTGGIPGLTLGDTIVAGNAAKDQGPDIQGSLTTNLGYNLIGGNPLLAPLGLYGGPTETMPLLPGSPAIGMGATMGPSADQRGLSLDSPDPDIGAFQTGPEIVVNTTLDGISTPLGDLDLRQAVNLANTLGAAETITFAPTVFATNSPITLTAGPIVLSDTGGLETIAALAAGLTVSGGGQSRVFQVKSGATASFSGLTITDGFASGGAGLLNYGTVTLTDCTISGNSAGNWAGGGISNVRAATTFIDSFISDNSASVGGGVYANDSEVTLIDCTMSGNKAIDGGAVQMTNSVVALSGCTVSGNSATKYGGGVLEQQLNFATLTGCTISGNSATGGGGLATLGSGNEGLSSATLINCTMTGNRATDNGGGVYNRGATVLTGCTLSGNTAAGSGGGVFNFPQAPLTIGDTIVAGNVAKTGADFFGTVTTDQGFNLVGVDAGAAGFTAASDQLGTGSSPINPLLAPLGNYGGPTATMPLLPGSPALGKGSTSVATLATGGVDDTTSTSVTIAAGSALDEAALLPLSSGDYFIIQIDSEQMAVTTTTFNVDGTVTLTVIRGVNGTEPATHAGGATVSIALDQRGMPLDSPSPDVGAFQSQGFTLTPVLGSTPQSADINTAFANPLAVTAMAKNPVEPVAGGVIDFAAPTGGGASATLSSTTATVGASGLAAITAMGNNTAGSYDVTASATGVITPAFFALTNEPALSITSIAAVSPNPRNSAVSTIDVTFSSPINTSRLTAGALTLTDNGGANLINSGVTLTVVSDTTSTYAINGLSTLTTAQGEYTLTVNAADIQDQYGFVGTGTAATMWLMDTTAPSSHVVNSLSTSQTSDSFNVSVSFSDPPGTGNSFASGVSTVELWVSVNNGPFTENQKMSLTTPETSGTVAFTFVGQDRNTYAFHSVAIDAATNTENKNRNAIEASTSVPDLNPPITHVLSSTPAYSWGSYSSSDFSGLTASSYSSGVFTINWAGVDPDQNTGTPAGSIKLVDIYVEVDGSTTPTLVGQLTGGSPNSNGVYTGSIKYNALADGLSHTYAFFSVGLDDEQKAQTAPATPDVTFSETYSGSLVPTLEVEKGIAERSYIQYLDVNFNQTVSTSTELQALQSGLSGSNKSSYVELLWYGENLASTSSSQGSVNLFGSGTTASVSLSGSDLSINLGANGITSLLTETGVSGTGKPTTNFGDGWYALGIDPAGSYSSTNNETMWLTFFRLFGSATGDETVSGPYTAATTDAYAVYHAEGQSGPLNNADVDGSGAVNSKDFAYTVASYGDKVGATMPANFPQFQLLAGGGTGTAAAPMPTNATPITQQEVRSLLPAAIAAWQAAGLDAADVRKLQSTPIVLGNLGTNILGEETNGVITINQTGAGFNWYVNATGASNGAFAPGAAAANKVDLLTVLEHELGHVIGLADNTEAGDLMDITLGVGERRKPTGADVAEIGSTPQNANTSPALPLAAAESSHVGIVSARFADVTTAVGLLTAQPLTQAQSGPVSPATVDAALALIASAGSENGDELVAPAINDSGHKSREGFASVVPAIRAKATSNHTQHRFPQGAISSRFAKKSVASSIRKDRS